jgi:hypothetical protein
VPLRTGGLTPGLCDGDEGGPCVDLRDLVDLMASLVMSMCRGKVKQDVIVCAILIDKTPNLAGLARTCEASTPLLSIYSPVYPSRADESASPSRSLRPLSLSWAICG